MNAQTTPPHDGMVYEEIGGLVAWRWPLAQAEGGRLQLAPAAKAATGTHM